MCFVDKEAVQLLLSDMTINIRLWNIESTTARTLADLDAFDDRIRNILIEIRDLEITHLVALTKERTTYFLVTFAQMLGILASPNSWVLLDLVSVPDGWLTI